MENLLFAIKKLKKLKARISVNLNKL